jgi:hypothetical protein
MEALIRNLRLFEDIFNRIEAFSIFMRPFEKLWGFSNTFKRSGGFCLEIWGFCKDYEAFKRHFQRSEGFFKLKWGLYKDKKAFWRHYQRNGGFCSVMWGFNRDFNYFWRLLQRNWGFFKDCEAFLKRCEAFYAFCSQSAPGLDGWMDVQWVE